MTGIFNAANILQRSYSWGDGDMLVSVTDHVENKRYLPMYATNFNITGYIDSSDGTVVARYEYDAFGKIISKSGTKANDFRFGFATYKYDKTTGLIYYGYRHYDPETGRFLSRDPIAETGGVNLYANCRNDMINFRDYLGLDWIITRDGKANATACRTDIKKDTIKLLAKKIKLDELDNSGWLRDKNGKPFRTDAAANAAMKFTIPNTIIVLLPELPNITPNALGYVSYFRLMRFASMVTLRDKVELKTQTYRTRKFKINYYDFNFNAKKKNVMTLWPVHGFILAGHGKFGQIMLTNDNKTAFLPISFMAPYKYGVVIAFGCNAQKENWKNKASSGADYYSSSGYVTNADFPEADNSKK